MFDKSENRTPEHWRNMADEARALADGLATEANRQHMLAIAETYDRLAEQAERERARSARPPAEPRKPASQPGSRHS